MAFLQDARANLKKRDLTTFKAASATTEGSFHTYDKDEVVRFAARLSKVGETGGPYAVSLAADGSDIWAKMAEGEFVCKLLKLCEDTAITEEQLSQVAKNSAKKTSFANAENLNTFLKAAAACGLNVKNVGSADLASAGGKEHLLLGLLWQLVRRRVSNEIKAILKKQEEEAKARGQRLKNYSANMQKALADPESYLCGWIAQTLAERGDAGRPPAAVAELSTAASDVLPRLLRVLDETPGVAAACEAGADPAARAQAVLDWAAEHGVPILTQHEDLVGFNQRLILPFVMSIFSWASQNVPGVESVYAVRLHVHGNPPAPAAAAAPAGGAAGFGGGAAAAPAAAAAAAGVALGSSSSVTGVYKQEGPALAAALVANLLLLVAPAAHGIAPLAALVEAHATATRSAPDAITAALGPIPALVAPPAGEAEGAGPADTKARIEKWVKGVKKAKKAAAAPAAASTEEGAAADAPAAEASEAAAAAGTDAGAAEGVPGLSEAELASYHELTVALLRAGAAASVSGGVVKVHEVDTVRIY